MARILYIHHKPRHMKTIRCFSTILFCCLFYACTNDRKEQQDTTDTTIIQQQDTIASEILSDIPWTAVLDTNTQKYTMVRSNTLNNEVFDTKNVLESINRKYPENNLSFVKQDADTLFVKVEDATYLTQASGSTGARVFLAESTYSLTEIPSVRVVFFDFKVGDHATPGPYTRKSFDFSMP